MNRDQTICIELPKLLRLGDPNDPRPILRRDRAPTPHLGNRARLETEFASYSGVPAELLDDVADIVHVDISTRVVSGVNIIRVRQSANLPK